LSGNLFALQIQYFCLNTEVYPRVRKITLHSELVWLFSNVYFPFPSKYLLMLYSHISQ
jgi:hypothetical protein